MAAIFFYAAPASAEIPIPSVFGDWNLYCFGEATVAKCSLELRTEGLENYRGKVGSSGFSVMVDLDGGNRYRVRSWGSNLHTCDQLQVDEVVSFQGPPIRDRYHEDYVQRLQARLLEILRTHMSLLGNCSPMTQPKGPFPTEIFDASISDFNAAVAAMAERVRARRPKTHPPLRPS